MSGKRKAKESKASNKKQKEEAAMMTSGASSSSGRITEDTSGFEFKRLLVNTPVENLAYKKPKGVVYFVDRTDKVRDVFKGLVNQGFLSVPVLQKPRANGTDSLTWATLWTFMLKILETFWGKRVWSSGIKLQNERDSWTKLWTM